MEWRHHTFLSEGSTNLNEVGHSQPHAGLCCSETEKEKAGEMVQVSKADLIQWNGNSDDYVTSKLL